MSSLVERLANIQATPLPPRLPKKGFNPANPEIPILDCYRNPPPKTFWKSFPVNRNWKGGTPFCLDTERLREWVNKAGAPHHLVSLLDLVIPDIMQGADLKVSSDYVPHECKNAVSAAMRGSMLLMK